MRGQNARHTGRTSATKTSSTIPNSPEAAAAIEAAIRKAAGKPTGTLTKEDYEKVKSIKWEHSIISDLTPLKRTLNLESIHMEANQISDLTPLAELKNLRTILLNRNRITDLTPLAGLPKLEYLDLYGNQITDLTPLAGLKQLNVLKLRDNPKLSRPEIDALKRALPNLVIFHSLMTNDERIEANIRLEVEKYGGELTEQDLAKSTWIRIEHSIISDLTPLKRTLNLESLHMEANQISDLTPLSELKNLRTILLNRNRITDLTPLAGLPKLEKLDLYGNQITNDQLKHLAGLRILRKLDLRDNQLTDVSALAGLKQLVDLRLEGNPKLTKAQIDQFQKALPKCKITHDATK